MHLLAMQLTALLENFQQMPGDRFALAIGVGGQIQRLGFLQRLGYGLEVPRVALDELIIHREAGVRVDRDRTKRPKMGQAAGEGSDFVLATSDNPRSEDPLAILAEIEPALKATGTPYTIESDRAAAIRLALEAAAPGDVVLIPRKGHEKEQILAGRTIPFDDTEIA